MKAYIVWNENKTEGFVTTDPQLAYEARKGAENNCFYEDGTRSYMATCFCETHSMVQDCTIEEIESE